MLTRLLIVLALVGVLLTVAWGKGKLDPQALMTQSDALYYYPAAHGVTDLAVDVVVEQLANHPVAKQARITYYFAGEGNQAFLVTNVPDEYANLRTEIRNLVAPFADYIMPRPAATNFTNLTLSATEVSRQILGLSQTQFYLLSGKATDEKAEVQEFRVLLDQQGLAHQVENVTRGGGTLVARIENVRMGDTWHIGKIVTRLPAKEGTQWKIDTMQYENIQNYPLVVRAQAQYRTQFNQPVKGLSDLTVRLENYRINTGEAAAALAKVLQAAPAPNAATDQVKEQPK